MRVIFGNVSFRISTRLPLKSSSIMLRPVTLRPGLAKLSARPDFTGSAPVVSTMGMVFVAFVVGLALFSEGLDVVEPIGQRRNPEENYLSRSRGVHGRSAGSAFLFDPDSGLPVVSRP